MVKFLEFASSVSLKNVKVEAQSEYHNDSIRTKASAPPWNFETPGIPKNSVNCNEINFFKNCRFAVSFLKQDYITIMVLATSYRYFEITFGHIIFY